MIRFLAFPLAGLCFAAPAYAQSLAEQATCGDREELTSKLTRKFGEMQQGTGLVSQNRVLELWRSGDGSWTVLMTRPDGKTCILAAGSFWRDFDPGQPGDPV